MEFVRLAAVAVVSVAALVDLRTRKIPNFLTFGATAVAVALRAWLAGGNGLVMGVSGWLVGVSLLLPLFLLRGMGAGDVKLLGAVGAWLGPVGALWAGFFTALAGGVLALVVATINGYTVQALRNLWALLALWRATGIQPLPGLTLADARGPRVPYGVAIALGTVAAVWFH